MRYLTFLTPTEHAKNGGRVAVQLGSREAVLAAHPPCSHLIVGQRSQAQPAAELAAAAGRPVQPVLACGGPAVLYDIPKHAVVGVDPDAFSGIPSAQWADMHRIIASRFATVHWG